MAMEDSLGEKIDNMEANEESETVGLMTDMKLDDGPDEFKNTEPDFDWTYLIEIYPWHAEDMSDKFVRLIRVAEFTRVVMRRKKNSKEESVDNITDTDITEDTKDDKLTKWQKMGCLQFYLTTRQSAKIIMRSFAWKTMAAKELTVEIKRFSPEDRSKPCETAYLEINTNTLCKCRFRDKATGELNLRSTEVSKIPGEITRGFLDVVLSRAYPITGDVGAAGDKAFAAVAMDKLADIEDFKGILKFDCHTRGSARAFVQAYKKVLLNGEELEIAAVDEQTMVTPVQNVTTKKKEIVPLMSKDNTVRGGKGSGSSTRGNVSRGGLVRGSLLSRGGGLLGRGGMAMGRGGMTMGRGAMAMGRGGMAMGRGGMTMGRGGLNQISSHPALMREVPARGGGRPTPLLMRPLSAPVAQRGGMPLIPMTGRQKMNEKLRSGMRVAGPGSVGDSFKAEIAHLQNQLTESTQAIQEKIAMLQGREDLLREDFEQNSYFDSEMTGGFNDVADYQFLSAQGWSNDNYGYNGGYKGNDRFSQRGGNAFSRGGMLGGLRGGWH